MRLTRALRSEYVTLFSGCVPSRPALVAASWGQIRSLRHIYEDLSALVGGTVPWHVLGALHMMEASCNLGRHLHNGDQLTARTTHVPVGRPKAGEPPFSWLQSAEDAVRMHGLHLWADWSLSGTLWRIEAYNGWGYRRYHPETKSPYLWGGSNQYTSGKYAADGKWDPAAVSRQIGAAVLLKHGHGLGEVVFAGAE